MYKRPTLPAKANAKAVSAVSKARPVAKTKRAYKAMPSQAKGVPQRKVR